MGIFWILLFILTFLICYFLYSLHTDADLFQTKNIVFVGHEVTYMFNTMFKNATFIDTQKKKYDVVKEARASIGGNTETGKVTLTVADTDLLKRVMIKDFEYFVDRRTFNLPKGEKLLSRILNFENGERWKALRSKLSPTFTTGKIKRMHQLFDESCKRFVSYINQRLGDGPSGEFDFAAGLSKYTMHNIATVVCGIDSHAFDQPEQSRFEEVAENLTLQIRNVGEFLKIMLVMNFPAVADWFKIVMWGSDVRKFFGGAVLPQMKHRMETGEKRNDFIQLLMEAKQGFLKMDEAELDDFEKDAQLAGTSQGSKGFGDILDEDGILANCMVFILAGGDTLKAMMVFFCYELALNPDIQDRLRAEVDAAFEEHGGEITYEAVHGMSYLDMVVNETMRLYSPVVQVDRQCVKDYQIPGTNVIFRKGDVLNIPLFWMQRDERYFPNPLKFDPERFSPENKGKVDLRGFMPFGQGPRNCIGMRFAQTEGKLGLAHLVRNFILEPCSKTLVPMQFKNSLALKPMNGMWLRVHKRF